MNYRQRRRRMSWCASGMLAVALVFTLLAASVESFYPTLVFGVCALMPMFMSGAMTAHAVLLDKAIKIAENET